ncbi:hypothetical protein VNO77_14296 [Canavalia gladiata]|uniref:C2 domain-containing protein n=1 Tax=Canavalia gladiata TaxID=3824 RepID=A0AAN9QNN1_CANGL
MSNILACYQLLELNVISAQDLVSVGRSMQTYAVAWIDPDRKLSTRVDSEGGINPIWDDKFIFRIDENFLYNEESTITIDIYALHWFRDIHVGTGHVFVGDIIPPPSQLVQNTYKPVGMQFMGLQVQRQSGRSKGILNVGVAIIDSSMRSMPLYPHNNTSIIEYDHDEENKPSHQAKPELRRSKSDTSSMLGSEVYHEQRAKAKKGKASSQVTPSEESTEWKNKTNFISSDSDVKIMPKKGKFNIKKKISTTHNTPSHFNVIQRMTSPKINIDYEVKFTPKREFQKSTPKREFQNSPARTRTYNNNNNYIGGVKATPLHALAMKKEALEYGTPFRSNIGRRTIMTDSELGPSASEVAATMAKQPMEEEEENYIVGGWSLDDSREHVQPKLEGWQSELPTMYDHESEILNLTTSNKKGKNTHRRTNGGGNGLFSCFSVICGVECSIVCGGGGGDGKKNQRRQTQFVDNESFL